MKTTAFYYIASRSEIKKENENVHFSFSGFSVKNDLSLGCLSEIISRTPLNELTEHIKVDVFFCSPNDVRAYLVVLETLGFNPDEFGKAYKLPLTDKEKEGICKIASVILNPKAKTKNKDDKER